MSDRGQLMFKILSILMSAFGVLGAVFSIYLVSYFTDGFRHNNWLDNGSAASSAIICVFSCIVCACGGIYGIAAKNKENRTGGFAALAVIAFAYFLAACLLSSGDNRVMILSFFGIVLSIAYVVTAVMLKNLLKQNDETEGSQD